MKKYIVIVYLFWGVNIFSQTMLQGDDPEKIYCDYEKNKIFIEKIKSKNQIFSSAIEELLTIYPVSKEKFCLNIIKNSEEIIAQSIENNNRKEVQVSTKLIDEIQTLNSRDKRKKLFLIFILSHELAHIELGHKHKCNANDKNAKINEIQADNSAAFLLKVGDFDLPSIKELGTVFKYTDDCHDSFQKRNENFESIKGLIEDSSKIFKDAMETIQNVDVGSASGKEDSKEEKLYNAYNALNKLKEKLVNNNETRIVNKLNILDLAIATVAHKLFLKNQSITSLKFLPTMYLPVSLTENATKGNLVKCCKDNGFFKTAIEYYKNISPKDNRVTMNRLLLEMYMYDKMIQKEKIEFENEFSKLAKSAEGQGAKFFNNLAVISMYTQLQEDKAIGWLQSGSKLLSEKPDPELELTSKFNLWKYFEIKKKDKEATQYKNAVVSVFYDRLNGCETNNKSILLWLNANQIVDCTSNNKINLKKVDGVNEFRLGMSREELIQKIKEKKYTLDNSAKNADTIRVNTYSLHLEDNKILQIDISPSPDFELQGIKFSDTQEFILPKIGESDSATEERRKGEYKYINQQLMLVFKKGFLEKIKIGVFSKGENK